MPLNIHSKMFDEQNQVSMLFNNDGKPYFLAAQIADIFGHHDAHAMLEGIPEVVKSLDIGLTTGSVLAIFHFPERDGHTCTKFMTLHSIHALEARYKSIGVEKGLSQWIETELLPITKPLCKRYNVRERPRSEKPKKKRGFLGRLFDINFPREIGA